jgi:hypothetical protein
MKKIISFVIFIFLISLSLSIILSCKAETIETVETPIIFHPYPSTEIEIDCDTPDTTIYYTIDGSTPTTLSNEYTEALSLSLETTSWVKAFAVKDDMNDSNVATFTCSDCH